MIVSLLAANAATLRVPEDYPTIQAALDVSIFPDVIEVGPGIWMESDLVENDVTTLRGSGAGVTIIDARGGTYGLSSTLGMDLEDLTLQGNWCLRKVGSVRRVHLECSQRIAIDSAVQVIDASTLIATDFGRGIETEELTLEDSVLIGTGQELIELDGANPGDSQILHSTIENGTIQIDTFLQMDVRQSTFRDTSFEAGGANLQIDESIFTGETSINGSLYTTVRDSKFCSAHTSGFLLESLTLDMSNTAIVDTDALHLAWAGSELRATNNTLVDNTASGQLYRGLNGFFTGNLVAHNQDGMASTVPTSNDNLFFDNTLDPGHVLGANDTVDVDPFVVRPGLGEDPCEAFYPRSPYGPQTGWIPSTLVPKNDDDTDLVPAYLDCDDTSGAFGPFVVDLPGDCIDQDCDGWPALQVIDDPMNDGAQENQIGSVELTADEHGLAVQYAYANELTTVVLALDTGEPGGAADLSSSRGYTGAFPTDVTFDRGIDVVIGHTAGGALSAHALQSINSTDITGQLLHLERTNPNGDGLPGTVFARIPWTVLYPAGVPANATVSAVGFVRHGDNALPIFDQAPDNTPGSTFTDYGSFVLDVDGDGAIDWGGETCGGIEPLVDQLATVVNDAKGTTVVHEGANKARHRPSTLVADLEEMLDVTGCGDATTGAAGLYMNGTVVGEHLTDGVSTDGWYAGGQAAVQFVGGSSGDHLGRTRRRKYITDHSTSAYHGGVFVRMAGKRGYWLGTTGTCDPFSFAGWLGAPLP